MIVRVQLKDPDGVSESLKHLDGELRDSILGKYFKYGEYALIEIDTSTLEAKLVPNK